MTLLIEAGLIEYSDYKDKRVYKTTENGIRDLID
jgi:predicted transcriptional regulator